MAESGLVINIKTPVFPLALESVHDNMPKEKLLSLYHTLSNLRNRKHLLQEASSLCSAIST